MALSRTTPLFFAASLALSAAGGAAAQTAAPPPHPSRLLDVAAMAQRLGEIGKSPALAVHRLLAGDGECRTLSLTSAANAGEAATKITVELIRDGFPDDSVRGDWHRFVFGRSSENASWKLEQARTAVRCWRGSSRGYIAGRCP